MIYTFSWRHVKEISGQAEAWATGTERYAFSVCQGSSYRFAGYLYNLGPIALSRFSVELDQMAALNWFTAIASCTILNKLVQPWTRV